MVGPNSQSLNYSNPLFIVGSNSYVQDAVDVIYIASAHELVEAATNPIAKEDGTGCWVSSTGYEIADLCENQRGFMKLGNNTYAMPSVVNRLYMLIIVKVIN